MVRAIPQVPLFVVLKVRRRRFISVWPERTGYSLIALRTIARMPTRTAWGRLGQASMRARKSSSNGPNCAWSAPDSAPP